MSPREELPAHNAADSIFQMEGALRLQWPFRPEPKHRESD